MALQKSQPTDVGVDATYHRIIRSDAYYDTGEINLIIGKFADKAASDDEKQPLSTQMVATSFEDLGLTEPRRTEAYNFLKTLPEFDGATDV